MVFSLFVMVICKNTGSPLFTQDPLSTRMNCAKSSTGCGMLSALDTHGVLPLGCRKNFQLVGILPRVGAKKSDPHLAFVHMACSQILLNIIFG